MPSDDLAACALQKREHAGDCGSAPVQVTPKKRSPPVMPDELLAFADDDRRSDRVGHLGPKDSGDGPDPCFDLRGVPPVSGPILRHGTGRESLGIGR
jgi:hypothetical protein